MKTQKNKLEKILRGTQEIIGELFHGLKTLVFPIEELQMSYDSEKKEEYLVPWPSWNPTGCSHEEKSNLAKAFNSRRKVNVGETYTSKLRRYHGWGGGSKLFIYDTNRIDENTILLDKYIVSTDNKDLLEHAKKGYTPIKYNWVIF